MIFGQGRKTNAFHCTINMKDIEITKEYKYLGILFVQSGSLLTSKKHIAEQGGRAMFSLDVAFHQFLQYVLLKTKIIFRERNTILIKTFNPKICTKVIP